MKTMTPQSGIEARSLKVLVVDDVLDNRIFATWMLTHLGHTVAEAENGQEAVDMMHRSAYDMVLMDIQMPKMDGLEAALCASKMAGGKPPIVACTALDNPDIRKKAKEVGMCGFITKPINVVTLRALIERVGRGGSLVMCA
ncbi:MAG: response regulator [Verrucomicrobiota bacterium]|nr:response regulator [Verrucomicrobiota bacterium]